MWKTLRIWWVAALLITGAFSIWSCAVPGGDLLIPDAEDGNQSPAQDEFVGVSSPGGSNGGAIPVDYEFTIRFYDHMDPASFVAGETVKLRDIDGNSNVTVTVAYEAETKTLTITPADDLEDEAAYLLTLTPGVTNSVGTALDGDEDGKQEGSPYDDFHVRYYTGIQGNTEYANILLYPAQIDNIFPFNFYPEPARLGGPQFDDFEIDDTITINFNREMEDGSLEDTGNYSIVNTKTGAAVSFDATATGPNSVSIDPDDGDLDFATQYTLTVKAGGVVAVEDATGMDAHLVILDTDKDGAEQTESDFSFDFITEPDPDADPEDAEADGTPPRIWYWNVSNDYVTVYFTEEMDTTSFTNETVRLVVDDWYTSAPVGGPSFQGLRSLVTRIIPLEDETGFKLTLDNFEWNGDLILGIASSVTDKRAGWPMDSYNNPNGIGGEDDDTFFQIIWD